MAVSNIPVFRELVEDLPVYFHPNNVQEMAAAMLQITLEDEQVRQRLLRPSLLNKISDANTAQQCVDLYQKSLREGLESQSEACNGTHDISICSGEK